VNEKLPLLRRTRVNRRAFLRGAGGAIAMGLPFLEGLPGRSAWAADDVPIFGFFLVAANGVVGKKFFPEATGALTAASFEGKALSELSPFASNLLLLKGVKYPGGSTGACGHAQGLCQALTGIPPQGSGSGSASGGISADRVISNALNGASKDPLNLYAGIGYYIAERVSFKAAGSAAPAQLNPYATYQSLMGVSPASTAPSMPSAVPSAAPPPPPSMTDELLIRRKSVNDMVREELQSLKAQSGLSSADLARLDQHLTAVRTLEQNMMTTGTEMMHQATVIGCTETGMNMSGLNAFKNGVRFSQQGNMIEDIVKLHFETVALAFACNANRVAALQWGDGTDGTVYSGISGPGWPAHQISHRTNNDSSVGTNAAAEQAHSEIDVIRMKTLAHGLKQFQDRGLFENSFVYWTTHISDGPSHSLSNLPIVIAGNAGGKLKQGQFVDSEAATNGKVLSTLISASGADATGFSKDNGAVLDSMLA